MLDLTRLDFRKQRNWRFIIDEEAHKRAVQICTPILDFCRYLYFLC